jgi:pilus assembly protein CpaB
MGPAPAGAAFSKADIVGRVTARNFAARETISRDGLRDASTLGIAARVQPGQRAFSIRIAEDDIVGGFLQSGDHVDVFATIPGSVFPSKTAGDVPDRSRSVLLLQNVAVLAVGENPATRGSVQSGARTVSLSLAPDGLARLALAERYGKVSLAIRMPGDNSRAQQVSAVLADLIPVTVPENSPSPSAPKVRRASGIPFYAGERTSSLSLGGSR